MDDFVTIECRMWVELPEKLLGMKRDLVERIIPIQDKSEKVWDLIRVEIWEDTGRIIAFPAKVDFDERIDQAGIQIVCEEMMLEVRVMDDLDLPDQELDARTDLIIGKAAQCIVNSFKTTAEFRYKVFNQDGLEIHL